MDDPGRIRIETCGESHIQDAGSDAPPVVCGVLPVFGRVEGAVQDHLGDQTVEQAPARYQGGHVHDAASFAEIKPVVPGVMLRGSDIPVTDDPDLRILERRFFIVPGGGEPVHVDLRLWIDHPGAESKSIGGRRRTIDRKISDITDFAVFRQDTGCKPQEEFGFIKAHIVCPDIGIAGQYGAAQEPGIRMRQRRFDGTVQHNRGGGKESGITFPDQAVNSFFKIRTGGHDKGAGLQLPAQFLFSFQTAKVVPVVPGRIFDRPVEQKCGFEL